MITPGIGWSFLSGGATSSTTNSPTRARLVTTPVSPKHVIYAKGLEDRGFRIKRAFGLSLELALDQPHIVIAWSYSHAKDFFTNVSIRRIVRNATEQIVNLPGRSSFDSPNSAPGDSGTPTSFHGTRGGGTNANEMDIVEETTAEGMRIERVGIGHYRCHSQSQATTAYSVDIMDYDGLGSCTCWDFTARRFPRWRLTHKVHDVFRCKHIRRVRNHVLDQIIADTINKLKKRHGR